MTPPRPPLDIPAILAQQRRYREANSIRKVGAVRVPAAWTKSMRGHMGGTGWVRMISFAVNPESLTPGVTVTDLKLLHKSSYLYVVHEQFNTERMSPAAFLQELARVTHGAVQVPYHQMESIARQMLQNMATASDGSTT